MKGPALHSELGCWAERPGHHKHCVTLLQMGDVVKGPTLLSGLGSMGCEATSSMGWRPGMRCYGRLCTAFGAGSGLAGLACSATAA